MIVAFALAIGTLGPFTEPVVIPIPAPEDCVKKGHLIPSPAPIAPRAVIVKGVPKRGTVLPKTPKKIVEDDCGEGSLPPSPTFVLTEEPLDYTPVPEVPLAQVPPEDVPVWPVQDEPEYTFSSITPERYFLSIGPERYAAVYPNGYIAAVPEPGTFGLLAGGLALLGWKRLKA